MIELSYVIYHILLEKKFYIILAILIKVMSLTKQILMSHIAMNQLFCPKEMWVAPKDSFLGEASPNLEIECDGCFGRENKHYLSFHWNQERNLSRFHLSTISKPSSFSSFWEIFSFMDVVTVFGEFIGFTRIG